MITSLQCSALTGRFALVWIYFWHMLPTKALLQTKTGPKFTGAYMRCNRTESLTGQGCLVTKKENYILVSSHFKVLVDQYIIISIYH